MVNLLCRYLCYGSLYFLGDVVNKKIGLLKTSEVKHPYAQNYDDQRMLYDEKMLEKSNMTANESMEIM